uniref:protein GUCD1 isoform X3 n=1 Tax=Myxine glutinosa TaxID=7769 RepID=UPI00358FCE5B
MAVKGANRTHDDGTNLHIGESRICSFTVSSKARPRRWDESAHWGIANMLLHSFLEGSTNEKHRTRRYWYARGVSEEEFLAAYHKLGLGQSVWTIDLAFLMATMNLSHHYCTQTLGVNRSYENQEFYHHDFATDELRVNRRFADAANSGVKVEKRAVSMSEVETHLAAGNVAIVLTDATILRCELCSPPAVSYCCFGSALPSRYPCHKHQYQGHFVTVCGYSHPDGSVFYNNPTCDRMCICTVKNFNEARTSYGTDEDILFVYKDAR